MGKSQCGLLKSKGKCINESDKTRFRVFHMLGI